jgi:hypothetical protein
VVSLGQHDRVALPVEEYETISLDCVPRSPSPEMHSQRFEEAEDEPSAARGVAGALLGAAEAAGGGEILMGALALMRGEFGS